MTASEATPLLSPVATAATAPASVGATEPATDDVAGLEDDKVSEDDRALPSASLQVARRFLYASHLSAQFSEQTWQFSLLLFLAAFTNYSSVFLVSSFGLLSGLAVCLAGPAAGRYFVDSLSWNRLRAAQFLIGTQNVSVLMATICCYYVLTSLQVTAEGGYSASERSQHDAILDWFQERLPGVPLSSTTLLLIVGIHAFGSIAQVFDSAFLVTIERDWIVVMDQAAAKGESSKLPGESMTTTAASPPQSGTSAWLSETNVVMKQIDLSCKVVAPAVAGFLLGSASPGGHSSTSSSSSSSHTAVVNCTNHAASSRPFFSHLRHHHHGSGSGGARDLANAALLVGLINVASLAVEYLCTARIYHLVPEMAVKTTSNQVSNGSNSNSNCNCNCSSSTIPPVVQNNGENRAAADVNTVSTSSSESCWYTTILPAGLRTYCSQPISWAGFGLAMLFFNALTFGGLMTAYLVWRGMRLPTVGAWRGVSSAMGLFGTVAYRYSTQRTTLVTTGLWSILYQLLFISISFASLFMVDDDDPEMYNDVSMVLFVGGVCLSRIGLWVFAITVTQLMQEFIPDGIRGVVGGTQQSLNALFQLSSFALGLVFPNPRDFPIYVAAGYIAVCLTALSFYCGIFLRREDFVTELEQVRRRQRQR